MSFAIIEVTINFDEHILARDSILEYPKEYFGLLTTTGKGNQTHVICQVLLKNHKRGPSQKKSQTEEISEKQQRRLLVWKLNRGN